MAKQNSTGAVQRQELEELLARVEYLDEERRKANKEVGLLEQRVAQQETILVSREKRIKDLETRLADAALQLNRTTKFDATLEQFKDELVRLIEQYEQRQTRAIQEIERLRRAEHESLVREMADVRKEIPQFGRLRDEMELRQAEEARLANLIGKLQTKLPNLENRMENWERELSFITANDQQRAKMVTQIEGDILELTRRLEPVHGRLDLLYQNVQKAEGEMQAIGETHNELRQMVKSWVDQIQLGEYERNQRITKWGESLEEFRTILDRYQREWAGFTEQHKEARMLMQSLTDWQKSFEQTQKELTNLSRVEINRMQVRWDNFLVDIEKRWRAFEVENEQRLAEGLRRDKGMEEQTAVLEEIVKDLIADKEALWRVQSAQLDAIKQMPRIWLEEVEKARARDPNRRREPSLVQVDEDIY